MSVDRSWVEAFCHRWQIVEFAFFGSVLREDFEASSDLDIIVEFGPAARVGFLALARIEDELAAHFGRQFDVVSKRGLRPRMRDLVLNQREVVHSAA